MLFRGGLVFSLIAIFLQIAVFLQPLLPKQYQVSAACETITQALATPNQDLQNHSTAHEHRQHALQAVDVVLDDHNPNDHTRHNNNSHDHHALDHQCLYCKVYAHVVPMVDFDIAVVADRLQVRLLLWQQRFVQHYFALQRLYLIPQGRAPPFSLLF